MAKNKLIEEANSSLLSLEYRYDGAYTAIDIKITFLEYLKGIIELQGKTYIRSNDLKSQIEVLIDTKDERLLNILNSILEKIDLYESWVEKYGSTIEFKNLTYGDIEYAIGICKELEDYCKNLDTNVEGKDEPNKL